MRAAVLLLSMLVLAGCDKITGAAEQKIADAEAVGFACRVAQKQPEACMKENEAQPPASLLDGWKSADEDIKAGKLDPSMSNIASEKKKDEPAAEGEKKPEDAKDGTKPVDGADKKGAEEKGADQKDAKPAEMKPADAKKDAAGDAAKKPAEAAHDKSTH